MGLRKLSLRKRQDLYGADFLKSQNVVSGHFLHQFISKYLFEKY